MRKYFVIAMVLLCGMTLMSQVDPAEAYKKKYAENILKEEINGKYIPEDIYDAFVQLDELSTTAGRAKLIEGSEEVVAERLTRGLGKWIMVNWNFYEGSRMSHYLKNMGVSIPDDMSQFIIVSYYRHLKGTPLELEQRSQSIFEKRKEEQKERNRNKTVISKS